MFSTLKLTDIYLFFHILMMEKIKIKNKRHIFPSMSLDTQSAWYVPEPATCWKQPPRTRSVDNLGRGKDVAKAPPCVYQPCPYFAAKKNAQKNILLWTHVSFNSDLIQCHSWGMKPRLGVQALGLLTTCAGHSFFKVFLFLICFKHLKNV